MAACTEGALPKPSGPFTVGCIDISVKSFPLIRLYYPGVDSSNEMIHNTTKWIPHPNYIQAYLDFFEIRQVKFSIARENISEKINEVFIPAAYGIQPLFCELTKENKQSLLKGVMFEEKCPVVIFSHGRGGMRTRYSAICCDLASHGYIVAVPEHTDGSSCLALKQFTKNSSDAQVIDEWIPYLHKDENETEFEFRNKQVMKRVSELQATHQLMLTLNKGLPLINLFESTKLDFDLFQFKNHIMEDSISLMGHSFGGATIIQALSTCTDKSLFKCGIALDPWMMPISGDVYRPHGITQPLLFINSALFYQTPESISKIMKLVKSPSTETGVSNCQLITIDGTVHLSQVDSGFILGEYFLDKDKPLIKVSKSFDVNMKLCHVFLKRHLLLDDAYQTIIPLLDGGSCDGIDNCIIYGTNVECTES